MNEIRSYSIEENKLKSVSEFIDRFEPYYVITIIITGLIGNMISFLLFTLTKLK